ncbi:hypothetical protein ACLB2K_058085 [Fragaria x ananassa]
MQDVAPNLQGPTMWRTVNMCGICSEPNSTSWKNNARKLHKICRRAVDLGGDNVVDIVAPKLTLLEDLELSYSAYTTEDLQAIGRQCPLLKSLKLNRRHDIGFGWDAEAIAIATRHNHYHVFAWKMTSEGLYDDGDALAMAGTMHGLKQLQIYGNRVTNKGLQAILDGCI